MVEAATAQQSNTRRPRLLFNTSLSSEPIPCRQRPHIEGSNGAGCHSAAAAALACQLRPLFQRESVGIQGALLEAHAAAPLLLGILQLRAQVLILGPPAAHAAGLFSLEAGHEIQQLMGH